MIARRWVLYGRRFAAHVNGMPALMQNKVKAHFSTTSRETMSDKIKRMLRDGESGM